MSTEIEGAPSEIRARPHEIAASERMSSPGLDEAIRRAETVLIGARHPDGHWVGELSSSSLATAIALCALWVTDRRRYASLIRAGRRWLFSTQLADGGWGDAPAAGSNLNSTSLALAALTLTAPQPANDHAFGLENAESDLDLSERMRRGEARLRALGGWEAVGDPGRCTLSGPCRTAAAVAGILQWSTIKRLRPEIVLLPSRLRRAISTTFPAYLSISTLHAASAPHPLNRLPTHAWALEEALRWLARAQGPNGSFEESAFLTSVIIMCLREAGFGTLPWLEAATRFVAESQRADGSWPIDRDLECFDTALSVLALTEAGGEAPAASAIRRWLLNHQYNEPCFPTGARPGGWSWALPAGWPDADDTAYALLALTRLGPPGDEAETQARWRGARWLAGMQNSDGSWSTFVRDSRLPFDHDCPYVTGHALSALQAVGYFERHPATRDRALAYLERAQRYDGTFASIWFREATCGTASVLEALADLGLVASPMAARARAGLLRLQNDDGGWGGLRLQPSTAEETAWATLALTRGGAESVDPAERQAAQRGVRWLIAHQRADGAWTPTPIGLYYSAMWYSDSWYALTFPLQALKRVRAWYGIG